MSYERQRLDLFMDELGSSFSTPGGGAAAALTAATAVALIEMVARINEKKSSEPPTAKIRRRLQALMTEDAKAFVKISALYKKGDKGPAMQKALKEGARCPEEICRLVAEAADLAVRQKNKTGKWLISDLKAAAVLLPAAFQAARFTVDVNLDGLKDASHVRAVRSRLNSYEKKLRRHCAQILGR
jgi:methenyltetrahydrofolate cyclohydrolase